MPPLHKKVCIGAGVRLRRNFIEILKAAGGNLWYNGENQRLEVCYMKKLTALLLALILAMAVTACAGPEEVAYVTTVPTEAETLPTAAPTEPPVPETDFSYEELKNHVFYFSSGAGGWRTKLYIHPDGSFEGDFSDCNMGESGEGYQSTQYLCDFSGCFGQPEPVNEYTLRLPVAQLCYDEATSRIIGDVRWCCGGEPYGLEQADSLLLYLPGAPLAELPEHFLRWVNLYDAQEETLSFYGLYNELPQNGFSSYDEIAVLRESLAQLEAREAEFQDGLTQAAMNIDAYTRYELWDNLLNRIWDQLTVRLDEEERKVLIAEEYDWILAKEAAVAEAGKEVEGGSLYPTVTNGTAANWTRDRVYVLMEKLEAVS